MKPLFILLILIISFVPAAAQTEKMKSTGGISGSREKLFIHHDKPIYQLKDTVWLTGYILNAALHTMIDSSAFAYVEIIDEKGAVVKRISPFCAWGVFSASMVLDEVRFKQGNYQLRAYTNYMRNFGDSLFFTSRFKILDLAEESWNTHIDELSFDQGRLLFRAAIKKDRTRPLAGELITLSIRSKRKTLISVNRITGPDGAFLLDTVLAGFKEEQLLLKIGSKNGVDTEVPIQVFKPEIDLQFLPEGGTFVAGKTQRLGFKALDPYGKSIDIKGIIKDSKGSVVTRFESIHKGMGIVTFKPELNEIYTAVPDKGATVRLPPAVASGLLLRVDDNELPDSIGITIDGSADFTGSTIILNRSVRGTSFVEHAILLQSLPCHLNISRNKLASGVMVIRLLDERRQPLNERALLIRNPDVLSLFVRSHKATYSTRDSVSLLISSKNSDGIGVSGIFSLAVIDTSQVRVDGDLENILSYMLLSSDLKGRVEDPYYYFKNPVKGATDALMLTQGWVSYDRKIDSLAFPYEKQFVIKGSVGNVLNKPVPNSRVIIFGRSGINDFFMLDTLTDKKGDFVFNRFPLLVNDSVTLIIQARNKKDKAFNVGVELPERKFPAVSGSFNKFLKENFIMDTNTHRFVLTQLHLDSVFRKKAGYLQEVIIKSKLGIPGSKNLNKDGGADQVLTEKDFEEKPRQTLRDLIKEKVKGIYGGGLFEHYQINGNNVRIVIDGVDMHSYLKNTEMLLDDELSIIRAEDVRGIEVMNTLRYTNTYRNTYLDIDEISNIESMNIRFIEVTTKAGIGPFFNITAGIYRLKPLYPSITRKFYSPRYPSKDVLNEVPDLRTTVFWAPVVATDKQGEATVSFYTSESRGGYLVIVQGTDFKGGLGFATFPISVEPKE